MMQPKSQKAGIPAPSATPVLSDASGGVFPFTLFCDRNGNSALQYQEYFRAAKSPGLTWYGYDVTIEDREHVSFTVYDMRNNFHGGLGEQIATFGAKVPADATLLDVERRVNVLAVAMRERELAAQEAQIIARYSDEIRAAINNNSVREPS